MALPPEEQVQLYQSIRDGDVDAVQRMMLQRLVPLPIDSRPFDALWHDPGPEATPLHLAACCLRPALVGWLLEQGADVSLTAQGRDALQMVDAFDLFAPARAQRPSDRLDVLVLLQQRPTLTTKFL